MLTLREDQIKALRGAKAAEFVERAVAFARETLPQRTEELSDEELSRLAETAIEKAVGYGLRSELDYIRYLGLMLTLAIDFDEQEPWRWVRKILEDPTLLPEEKLPEVLRRRGPRSEGGRRPG